MKKLKMELLLMKRSLVKHYNKFALILFMMLNLHTPIFGQVDSLVYPPNSLQVIPSLNFKNADIRDVLRAIALEYKTNIVVDNNVDSKISVALFKISVIDAIEIIAVDNNYEFDYDANRFFVKTASEKPKPKPFVPKPRIKYYAEEDKIDLQLFDTDIRAFVELIREETSKNFLVTRGTNGNISGKLNAIDFETGLKNILHNNGFYYLNQDSIIYISRSAYFSGSPDPNQKSKSPYWVSAKDNLVTLDVSDADLGGIIDDLTNQLNLQVIKLDNPKARSTVKCVNAPLDKALNYLFKGTEYSFKKEDETYIFGNRSSNQLDNIKLVKLLHLRADKLIEKLPPTFSKDISIDILLEQNAFIVKGSNENISAFTEYISKIDEPVPQVMIEALVVDYNLDDLYDFGISAGVGDPEMANRTDKWYPGIDVTASGNRVNKLLNDIGSFELFGKEVNVGKLGKLPEDFYINVRMMEENGIANIRSRPLLSTLNGHPASLKIGTIQNYVFKDIQPIQNQVSSTFIEKERIQQIEAMISFEITPFVGPNNQLTLELKPDFKTPVGQFSPDKNLIPAINTRTLESTVKLKDGETIVVGGLIQDIESNIETKFPILGDIPLLGLLFTNVKKQKTKTELIIYITPRIFYEDEFGYAYYEYAED